MASEAGGKTAWTGWLAAALAVALLLWFAQFLPGVLAGQIFRLSYEWVPGLDVRLAFTLDGLALIFALLVSGIGTLIFLYATGYMGGHPQFARLIASLFAFMISMLGLVLSSDLITLFVFWELTSITSYLLIGFDHNNAKARRNALQAMLITGAGGLAGLAGFILIGLAAGSYDLTVILSQGLQGSALYPAILLLVLAAAFTKSAQVPFHFWLPNAMAAPTPVSAFLHSATMVKAGVYLLARLSPALGGTWGWEVSLTAAGAVTAIWASLQALRQSDLKQSLAMTTLMALGVITLMIGQGALAAAMLFIIVHAFYKAALFMVVGAVDHATGTRELSHLGGLMRSMPGIGVAAVLAAASMAGLPPFIGWAGKEVLYLQAGPLAATALVISNALIFALAGLVALRPFFGAPKTSARHPTPVTMQIGPLVLAVFGLLAGVFGLGGIEQILGVSLAALGMTAPPELHLWAGFGRELALSLLTFGLGGLIYVLHARIVAGLRVLNNLPLADWVWDQILAGFKVFAARVTRLIQTGRHSDYLLATLAVIAATLSLTLLVFRPVILLDLSAPLMLWLIGAFTLGGGALALVTHSRIAAIAGISTVGIGVALIFIWFSAPDVATTQLMVEALSAVLISIAALRLPGLKERRSRPKMALHAGVALVLGVSVTLIILAITSHPLDLTITTWYEARSYLEANGQNIVNVILVDFRAIDTFGELTVVLLAAIGAYALLRGKGGAR